MNWAIKQYTVNNPICDMQWYTLLCLFYDRKLDGSSGGCGLAPHQTLYLLIFLLLSRTDTATSMLLIKCLYMLHTNSMQRLVEGKRNITEIYIHHLLITVHSPSVPSCGFVLSTRSSLPLARLLSLPIPSCQPVGKP